MTAFIQVRIQVTEEKMIDAEHAYALLFLFARSGQGDIFCLAK